MENELLIETILVDADAWGLRFEVQRDAAKYLQEGLTKDQVEAHLWAYEDWIK